MQAKSGPNLNDIFTVSNTRAEPSAPKEERPLSRTRLSRPYSGDRPSSRTQLTKPNVQESEASTSAGESDNDTPPPSYTSLTNVCNLYDIQNERTVQTKCNTSVNDTNKVIEIISPSVCIFTFYSDLCELNVQVAFKLMFHFKWHLSIADIQCTCISSSMYQLHTYLRVNRWL